jgi:hypothetical protein
MVFMFRGCSGLRLHLPLTVTTLFLAGFRVGVRGGSYLFFGQLMVLSVRLVERQEVIRRG